MNGRKPTIPELLYVDAAKRTVGCYACEKLGYENDWPPEYLAVHHNPDKGSSDKYCHFFSVPLCAGHHQGVVPIGCQLSPDEPVRHSQLGSRERLFRSRVGSDIDMCADIWERLPVDALDKIGMATGIYGFEDLLRMDGDVRNVPQQKNFPGSDSNVT